MGSTSSPNCDIVIPIWNQMEWTKRCLESVLHSTGEAIRFILVDNGSLQPTRSYLDQFENQSPVPVILIRNSENLGFVKAVNQGLRAAQAQWVCLLNNDTLTAPGWLEEMMKVAQNDPRVGLVNPTSNSLGFSLGDKSLEAYASSLSDQSGQWVELPMAVGFCLFARRSLFDQIGFLDETFGMGYFEDEDISRRTQKAGFLCVRSCASYVFHEERASFSTLPDREALFRKNRRKFEQKWGRSVRILWIVSGADLHPGKFVHHELIRQCSRQGHWITFADPHRLVAPELLDVAQVHRLKKSFWGWRIGAVCKLLLRRKKPFDLVISDDDSFTRWARLLHRLHLAEVIHRPVVEEIAACLDRLTSVEAVRGR